MIVKVTDVDGFQSPDASPRIMQYLLRRDNVGVESFVLGITTMMPGCESAVAQHPDEEAYFVLDGVLSVTLGGEHAEVGRDTAVFITPNVAHKIANKTNERVRFLWVMTPHPKVTTLRPGWTLVPGKTIPGASGKE